MALHGLGDRLTRGARILKDIKERFQGEGFTPVAIVFALEMVSSTTREESIPLDQKHQQKGKKLR